MQGVCFSTMKGLESVKGESRGTLGEVGGGGRRTSVRGTNSFSESCNFDGPGVGFRDATWVFFVGDVS